MKKKQAGNEIVGMSRIKKGRGDIDKVIWTIHHPKLRGEKFQEKSLA